MLDGYFRNSIVNYVLMCHICICFNFQTIKMIILESLLFVIANRFGIVKFNGLSNYK